MNTLRLPLSIFCLAVSLAAQAQNDQFSYISDRRFTSPDQLMGYDFKPAMREVPGEEPKEIKVGEYSFGITRKNLYVEGGDIRGVYNLNEINTTEYGYILRTMNARDPTVQGHLKIVVDEIGQVEGLIFKRSNNDKEVIYFLRMIPEEVAAAELEYFTNKGALNIPTLDSLWSGIEVRPFLRIFNSMGGIQQRVLPSDSVSLRFYHITTIEEKDNKLAALTKGRRKKGDKESGADEASAAGVIDDASITASTSRDLVATPAAQVLAQAAPATPKKLEFGLSQPNMAKPTRADSTLPIGIVPTGIVPTGAGLAQIGPDSLGLAELDSLAAAEQVLAEALAAANPVAQDSSDVKFKITTQFFVDLNSFMRFKDGTSEMQHRTYLVNGALERVNHNSRPGADRYQWELNLHKQPTAYVYLDERYNVNSIEIDGQKFYMRGQ